MTEVENAGRFTTLPLSEAELQGLMKQKRVGYYILAFGLMIIVGFGAWAIAVSRPGLWAVPVGLNVVTLAFFYGTTVRAIRDVRRGTKERYEGPWQERLVISGNNGDVLQVQLAIHGAGHIITVTRRGQVNLFRQAGISQEWTDGRGTVEYSSQTRMVEYVSIPPRADAPPTAEQVSMQELGEALVAAREAAKARRAGHSDPE